MRAFGVSAMSSSGRLWPGPLTRRSGGNGADAVGVCQFCAPAGLWAASPLSRKRPALACMLACMPARLHREAEKLGSSSTKLRAVGTLKAAPLSTKCCKLIRDGRAPSADGRVTPHQSPALLCSFLGRSCESAGNEPGSFAAPAQKYSTK
jgi:hypothetical protein